jgi:hypothetical protein
MEIRKPKIKIPKSKIQNRPCSSLTDGLVSAVPPCLTDAVSYKELKSLTVRQEARWLFCYPDSNMEKLNQPMFMRNKAVRPFSISKSLPGFTENA